MKLPVAQNLPTWKVIPKEYLYLFCRVIIGRRRRMLLRGQRIGSICLIVYFRLKRAMFMVMLWFAFLKLLLKEPWSDIAKLDNMCMNKPYICHSYLVTSGMWQRFHFSEVTLVWSLDEDWNFRYCDLMFCICRTLHYHCLIFMLRC